MQPSETNIPPIEAAVHRAARRRPDDRPEEILRAAERIFSQHGYERATTRQIAAAAGVSEGTLYNYFSSKQEMLKALFVIHDVGLRQDVEAIRPGDFEETLVQLLVSRLRFAHDHPLMIIILQQAIVDPEMGATLDSIIGHGQDLMMTRFRELMAAGVLREVDPFVVEEALGSMIMGLTVGMELALRGWHREPMPPEGIARALVDVLMNGLRAKPTLEDNR